MILGNKVNFILVHLPGVLLCTILLAPIPIAISNTDAIDSCLSGKYTYTSHWEDNYRTRGNASDCFDTILINNRKDFQEKRNILDFCTEISDTKKVVFNYKTSDISDAHLPQDITYQEYCVYKSIKFYYEGYPQTEEINYKILEELGRRAVPIDICRRYALKTQLLEKEKRCLSFFRETR